jgi:ribosomal-protein-alanine N-acetyltransferase
MTRPSILIAETPRLVLRHFDPSDTADLRSILADPEVMRFSVSGPLDAMAVGTWLTRIADSYALYGFGHWAVVRRNDERLLGFCGLSMQTLDDGKQVEIGYRLAHDVWGHGYGTEAATAVRDYAFREVGLERLIAIIDPANVASLRIAANLGMSHDRDTMYFGRRVHVFACRRDGAVGAKGQEP